jgi:hypothetical protein
MSTKASTAALRQICQRSFFHQRRVPSHPASGREMPATQKAPTKSGPFWLTRYERRPEILYCGATGYFGRGGIGL